MMKTCEECNEEYEAGTGVSEPMFDGEVPPYRLTERFCSKSCAHKYELEMDGFTVQMSRH